jgi:hypothetical protein
VSLLHLQRAIYHLSTTGEQVRRPADPATALARLVELSRSDALAQLPAFQLRLELDSHEVELIERGDVAGMYHYGVHPNLVRNFAGAFRIDYVARYREAGL